MPVSCVNVVCQCHVSMSCVICSVSDVLLLVSYAWFHMYILFSNGKCLCHISDLDNVCLVSISYVMSDIICLILDVIYLISYVMSDIICLILENMYLISCHVWYHMYDTWCHVFDIKYLDVIWLMCEFIRLMHFTSLIPHWYIYLLKSFNKYISD